VASKPPCVTIDLTKHQGEHPRLGATDVVPFVPIRGVSLAECVEIAKTTGRAIADRLKIPVYLYEAAATRPDRSETWKTSDEVNSKDCAMRSPRIPAKARLR
jgi:glutamate formiminotransferase